jgi:hypothetical protein
MAADTELSGEIAGQKFSAKNLPFNTIFTILTFVGICMLGTVFYFHWQGGIVAAAESRDDRKEFIAAVKEQTLAIREGNTELKLQNCLSKFPEAERKANDTWCKQITGAR